MKSTRICLLPLLLLFGACQSCTTAIKKTDSASAPPAYDQNYAWQTILTYEKMGPLVPGTPKHKAAGDWIVSELKKFGATVHEQTGTATTWDNKVIPVRNIIAQYNPGASTRYFLSAHWDTRPVADEDIKDKDKPILGVNDGGSGVAVLLGTAKALQNAKLVNQSGDFGVDLIFWDAEDWGRPPNDDTYCLGTQIWAKNTVPANYHAKFGINFDMVGRIGSLFPLEGISAQYAPHVMRAVQAAAQKIGYRDYFPSYTVGPITDDHYYVIKGTGIPTLDLIYMTDRGMFPPEWHTHRDTSAVMSRDVLKAVAQTSIQTLWDQ